MMIAGIMLIFRSQKYNGMTFAEIKLTERY